MDEIKAGFSVDSILNGVALFGFILLSSIFIIGIDVNMTSVILISSVVFL